MTTLSIRLYCRDCGSRLTEVPIPRFDPETGLQEKGKFCVNCSCHLPGSTHDWEYNSPVFGHPNRRCKKCYETQYSYWGKVWRKG